METAKYRYNDRIDGNVPDDNSMESVWSYIKMKLKQKSVCTVKQLIFQIIKMCNLCLMNTHKSSSKV